MTGKNAASAFAIPAILLLLGAIALFMLLAPKNLDMPKTDISYTTELLPTGHFDFTPPALPDLDLYTTESIRQKLPPVTPGEIGWEPLWDSPEFKQLQIKEDVDFVADHQETDDPFWLVLRSGTYDLPALYGAVADNSIIEKMPDGYLIKAPVLIAPSGTLVVNGPMQKLYLSTHHGAMISSYGGFYALDTTITSWEALTKSHTVYDSKHNGFRPYLQFLDDGKTYIAGSTLQHLGYNSSKGFGLSFSANENRQPDPSAHTPVPMTGWVVNNQIIDLYYGYYTFKAANLVLVGNTFRDNIIYGIDPHDYSTNLLIARNDVSGTKKKHGIIISRSVSRSFIIDNKVHQNHGSGIMLDRQCSENVIAHNISANNHADGLFFSESPRNISFSNILKNNARSGLRLRNSDNIRSYNDQITGNAKSGIVLYTADLSGTERDFELDPYTQKTGGLFSGTILSHNDKSHLDLQNFDSVSFYNMTISKTPAGVIFTGLPALSVTGLQTRAFSDTSGVMVSTTKAE